MNEHFSIFLRQTDIAILSEMNPVKRGKAWRLSSKQSRPWIHMVLQESHICSVLITISLDAIKFNILSAILSELADMSLAWVR